MNLFRLPVRRERPVSGRERGLTVLAVPLIVFFLCMPMHVSADIYYVDATGGLCSDAGIGSQDQPYCTIGAALAQHHAAGTTIQIAAGTYREQITLPASGVEGSPIVVQAAPGATVVIDGWDDFSSTSLWRKADHGAYLASSVTWPPTTVNLDGQPLLLSTEDPRHLSDGTFEYVAGQGLYVRSRDRNPGSRQTFVSHRNYGVYASGRSWVTVAGLTIVHAQDRGIQLTNAEHVELTGNDVSLSGRFGIQMKTCTAIHAALNKSHDNGDHGISMVAGTTGCAIEHNECFGNVYALSREANGIYLFGSSRNLIRANRLHDNQDTGLQIQSFSDSNLCLQNQSWHNGDHGFDHLRAYGNVHIGDVAYGNYKDGFSIEGNAHGQVLSDCIAIENGLTTNEYDLWVDDSSSVAFESNDNIFWNSTAQPPIKYGALRTSVDGYSTTSGQDTRTFQVDPRFVDPERGDFHLRPDSPAIDNGSSAQPDWPASDADGLNRFDDPAVPNNGQGPVSYTDRGAFEFMGGGGVAAVAPRQTPSSTDPADRGPRLTVQPNPFPRGRGVLTFRLSRPGRITASMYALDGRQVCLIVEQDMEAGEHSLSVPIKDDRGLDIPGGVYFCEVAAPEGRAVKRVVVVP